MRIIHPILLVLVLFASLSLFSQPNVLNPADPEIVFSSSNQPAAPSWDKIYKWGHSRRLSWDTYAAGYKCYYFKGSAFRIKFPKTYQHNIADGKKYPVFVFFSGLGEQGNIWDNEVSVLWGGQEHARKVDDGTFDGFLIYPQSQSGYYDPQFAPTAALIDSMVKYVKADQDRVIISGLSSGGQGVWNMAATYYKTAAALIPLSAARMEDTVNFSKYITIPVWTGNGGLDNNPYPENATIVFNAFKRPGGKLTQFYRADQGHNIWTYFWAQPNYYATLKTFHKANPLVYFGRTEFCPNETINVKLGLQAGFYAYEWQKDGATIAGATTNTLTVTAYGTYRGRFKRTATSNWSDWSPTPVVIATKQPTVAPVIQTKGIRSKVLPAPDGSTTVPLMEPATYSTYEWRRVSDNALVSDSSVYPAAVAGQQYKVKVTEPYGCSSVFSSLFSVVNANGSGAPDKVINVLAKVQSNNTSVLLSWTNGPNLAYKATGSEVYRATTTGGPYTMVGLTTANATSFLDNGLTPKTRYYYIVRAVNGNGAAPVSTETSVITNADSVVPTAPANLHLGLAQRDYMTIYWDTATDNVKVTNYAIYINGVRTYTTTATFYNVFNLDPYIPNTIYVKAEDLSGNQSLPSNQITATPMYSGLSYNYYEGNWSALPKFNTTPIVYNGMASNTDLSKKRRAADYGFMWQGHIYIKTPGTYYLETYSSAGSALYIPKYALDATPIINNDGVHPAQYKGANYTFSKAGWYTFAVTYFQASGSGEEMKLYWTCPEAGIPTRTLIPDSVFSEKAMAPIALPAAPATLKASSMAYDRIALQWSDNSTNETGYEIVRSPLISGNYTTIATVTANTTAFIDSNCKASTVYYYKVKAVNNSGASAYGPEVKATTGPEQSGQNKPPVLNAINNVFLNPGSSAISSFTATDDPGETLTVNVSNLPSFATYQKTGNGAGQFTFNPGTDDVGIYTITVTITDNYNGRTQKSFNVIVNDKTTKSVYINIGMQDEVPSQKPWNNMLAYPSAGMSLTNLKDGNDVVTPYSLVLMDKFAGNTANGMITGSNTGVFSDDVIKGGFYESTTSARRIKFSGLNKAKKYNVVLYGSVNSSVEALAAFSSGSQTVKLNGKYNHNQSAQLNWLTPDVNSEITVTMTKDAASYWAVLSAVILEEYDSTVTILNPACLLAEPVAVDKVKLTWSDRTNKETGYQVYRASSASASYVLITTVAAGSTTYTDTKLAANTKFYYKVRAINGSVVSDYSNVAASITAKRSVYINFEAGESPAPFPWNNTKKQLVTGAVVRGVFDNKGYATGFDLTMISDFNDEHVQGVSTGNNSGIYPDSVMRSTCWLGPNQTTSYKLTGLDQSKAYRVWFFGSWKSSYVSDYTTTYTINGKTAYLNCYNNSTKAVYVDDVKPDDKGEMQIDVYAPSTSVYGFQSSLVIDYYDPGLVNQNKPAVTTPSTVTAVSPKGANDITDVTFSSTEIKVYPNPFTQQLNVSFAISAQEDVSLQLLDMNGRILLRKDLKNAWAGVHNETLGLSANVIPKGTYFVRIVSKTGISKMVKVVKE